jgi:hypothetical protein
MTNHRAKAELDYDATVSSMTAEGSATDEVLRDGNRDTR